jgi:hypothetical protein
MLEYVNTTFVNLLLDCSYYYLDYSYLLSIFFNLSRESPKFFYFYFFYPLLLKFISILD